MSTGYHFRRSTEYTTMAYGQNSFYPSKSLLEADILNTSLQSEESFGLHVDHTENGCLSRDMASEENFTSGLSCLDSVESVLQDTISDSLRHDGGNPVFSQNAHPNDAPDEQTLSNNTSSLMDQNSYEAALEPVLLTMTSVDCYSDISSCSEKDFSWISDICAEKNSIQCSEYQMIESTKDMLIGQVENNSSSFEAETDVALEGWDEVTEKQNLDISANVEEDRSQSDCSNTVMEVDGQGERLQLKLENKCTNPIDSEYENVCALKTGEEDPNKGFVIQHSNSEAATIDTETVCGLDFISTRQTMVNENIINEDGHVEDGDHLKEETKMPKSNHNGPENLSNLEFEKSAHDGKPQYDKSEKKMDIGYTEQSNSFEFLQSCFDMSSLDHTIEPEPNVLVCGAMNQIHHNCDVNHTGQLTTSQIQDAADEGVQEPPVFNTCNKAQVSPEPGQQNASVEDQIITNIARTECGNDTGAASNVLLSSNKFMKKLQPVVLVQTNERSVNDGNAYQCSVCQQTTQNLDEVIEHHHYRHLQHEFNYCHAYGCYFSTETFAVQHFCGPKYLQQHDTPKKLNKSLDPTYLCQYCSKPFIRKAAHHDHEQRHIVVTKYRCKCCGLFFPQKSLMSSHRRKTKCTPLIVDPFTQLKGCFKMDLQQRNKPTFKVEDDGSQVGLDCFVKLIDITKDQSTQEMYPVSGQSSKHQQHLKTHTDKKPFKCDKCKKCFKFSWNLDIHKREQCSAAIKRSKRTAAADCGRYACPICSHVYLYPQNVSRHLQKVCLKEYIGKGKGKVGTRYKCPLCDETFSMSYNRSRHIRRTCFQLYKTTVLQRGTVVKEEKEEKKLLSTAPQNLQNYQCKVCPARFSQRYHLSQHMKKHELFQRTAASVDKPDTKGTNSSHGPPREECTVSSALTCHFCEKRFSKGCSLKKHLHLHKGNKPYRCLECGKNFKERRHMMSHKNVHRRKIQCSVCKKIVPTIEDLLKHRQSHVKKGVLQCPDCPMQFRFPVLFVRHVATHEKKSTMKTTMTTNDHQFAEQQVEDMQETKHANKSMPKSTGIPIKHQTLAQEVKENNSCAVCKKTFDDFKALSKHCKTHLPPFSVTKCPFCVPDRHFKNRTAMVRHIRLHTGEKPFPCQKCGVRFRRKEALLCHELKCNRPVETPVPLPTSETEIHDEQLGETNVKKKFYCSYCPYIFSKRFNLNMHERAHKANNLAPCSKCRRYYKKNKLYKHAQECKSSQSYPEHAFSSKTINTHRGAFQDTTESEACKTPKTGRRSEDKSVDRCPHCSKLFRYESYLIRHLRTHLNKNSFACNHCLQTFADQNSYLEHERSCDNAKPLNDCELLKCHFCTKAFLTPKSLRQHVLTHNDLRPYQCEACERSFTRKDHLKRHRATCKGMRVKLEVRDEKIPLDQAGTGKQTEVQASSHIPECSICSKTFTKKASLTRHIAVYHSTSAPFSCGKCGNTVESLKRHNCTGNCETSPGESLKPKNVPPKLDVAAPKELRQLLSNEERHCPDTWKLQCEYCFRYFKFPSQLKAHVLCHTGEKPFKCEKCDGRFARGDYLKRHMVKCSGKQDGLEVLCKRCGGLFNQEALDAHQVNCNVNCPQSTGNSSKVKGFPCSSCDGHFLLFSQLQEHVLTKHATGGLQHSNTECQQLTETLDIKAEAMDEGYSENLFPKSADGELNKPFKCQQCSLRFLNRAGLATHMRVHASKWPLSCKKCNKGFWKKTPLNKHMRKCKDVLKKECDSSELEHKQNDKVLVFNNGSNTVGTGVLQTKFSCKDQDEGETGKGDAVVHKYQCSECDQSFTDGLRLLSHLEAHGREDQEQRLGQQHSCNFCDETFDQAGLLRTHVKTCHQSTADNTCLKCSKNFRYPSDLVLHQSCHDPKRPFVCDKCELRYWTAKALSTHERVAHSVSEPIKTTRSTQRNSSGSNVFTCDPCNKIYMNKTSYLRHCRMKHRHSERLSEPKSATVEQQVDENESTGNDGVDEVSVSDDDYDSDSAPYFPCHVCGKTFLTSESLEDHQRCHLGEKPFECEECGKCFFQLGNLQQHQRSHKSEFQCQMCGKGFVSLFALRKHKHTHGRKRPHQCPKCALTFTKSSELAEHMVSHRNENFPCDVCHQNFSCNASRAEHRKIHTETEDELPPLIPPTSSASAKIHQSPHEYKYSCEFCQVRFPDQEQLSEHRCKQEKERQYSCTECDMNFLHGSHLKKHQLTHQLAGTRSFPCNTCHMSFSHRSHFLTHLQTHGQKEPESPNDVMSNANDPSQEKIYKCPICPESFAQALELANHLSVHSHMCNVCSKTFGTKQQLEIHEQSHLSAATQYECTECGKSFLGSDAFRQHYCANKRPDKHPSQSSQSPSPIVIGNDDEDEEEVDVGEDFYNCPTCNKRFSSSIGLLDHQKLHKVERPFKCLVCGKDFTQKRNLKRHQARHDEQPYRCDKCSESFKTQSAFASHCKAHDAHRHHCSMCNRSYMSRYDLIKHEKKHRELQSRGEERGEHRCDMCYKSFSLPSQLQQHQESHIGQIVYECTECDKAFAFLSLLEEHQQTHAMSVDSLQTQTGSYDVFQEPVF